MSSITPLIKVFAVDDKKPDFDGTSMGIACSDLRDHIKSLTDKQAHGGLTQDEASDLGMSVSNYKDVCNPIYGGSPLVSQSGTGVAQPGSSTQGNGQGNQGFNPKSGSLLPSKNSFK